MTTHFFAFDTIRSSTAAYTHASRDSHWGVVRFHTSHEAARRMVGSFGEVVAVTIATPEQRASVKAAKAADKAARQARQAAFDEQMRKLAS